MALVREEMSDVGVDPDALVVREVHTDSEADALGFVGSPTILIDGRDVQPPGEQPAELTCRVYRLRDGRISPLPDREDIREAMLNGIRES